MTNLKPPPVYKVIVAQVFAATAVSLVALFFSSFELAYSLLLGGLISSISNWFFTSQAFKYRGARNAKRILRSFLAGEIGKLVITVVMFALCFSFLANVIGFALIMGFLFVHVVGVAVSATINYSPMGHKTMGHKQSPTA